ncbi:RDD family protein [Nocardia jinanensis]|nr:RDD family protein [Nocardia jinanensis]
MTDRTASGPETDPDLDTATDETAETAADTDISDAAESTSGTDISGPDFASWRARALAFVVDTGCPAAVLAVSLATATVAASDPWMQVPAAVVAVAVLAAAIWNIGYRQGKTGRTLGKTLLGIRTDRVRSARPPGVARALFRAAAHLVDTVPLLTGWFWPLRDARRQTFADKLADTVVVVSAGVADTDRTRARRFALGGFGLLALVTVGLATTQYTVDYRHDRATERTRTEVARIAGDYTVALLSYEPDTVESDLSAAGEKLTGDFLRYYQDYTKTVVIPAAKEKKVATRAQAAGAAVLNADDRHATVLVFINQATTTADNPQPAAMSSTVRVELVEIGHEWRISQFEPI